MFCRSKFSPVRPNCAAAIVNKTAMTTNTIKSSMTDAPFCECVSIPFIYFDLLLKPVFS